MGQFRKKPVQIEARIVTRRGLSHIAAWCGGQVDNEHGIAVNTLHGVTRAAIGDYVVRSVNGDFYPCRADIFLATHEPVAQDSE